MDLQRLRRRGALDEQPRAPRPALQLGPKSPRSVCLRCRRELAADAAVGGLSLSLKQRARLRSTTIVEFEVRRTPDRTNTQIANAVHSSIKAVEKARERLAASGGLV
jgi:hypothetical protein